MTHPTPTRPTPSSIPTSHDLCAKWTLWHRGDHIDSLLCCKLFPERHTLSNADIATAFSILHAPCANMVAQDVAELWRFLESYPELFTNGYRYWERIRGKLMEAAMRPMEVKIEEEGDRGEGENGGDEGGEGNGKGKREDGGNGNRRSKWNWRGTPLDRGERWYEERELEHKVDASIGRFRGACGK